MKKYIKKAGNCAALLLLLPFYAVIWMFYTVIRTRREFVEFSREFISSMTVPDHIIPPIGLKLFYLRKECRRSALAAEEEYEYAEAIKYWRICAACYDLDAMKRVADHYRFDECGNDAVVSAREWYAIAASFGDEQAEKHYEHFCGYNITAKEKLWVRKTFIKSRRRILKETCCP